MMKLIISAKAWEVVTWIAIFIIIMGAILFQHHTLINWDVSFLMEATKRFLEGGTYTQNFFETNPPMIFYLYIPPVLFGMKYLGLTKATALILYIVLLSLLTIYLCNRILKKILLERGALPFIVLFSIAFISLLLPTYEFGQREHLLLILAMPYLFLAAARVENIEVNTSDGIMVGFLAGLGFAIKPFFPITLVLVELYHIIKKQNVFACFRIETIIILLVFVSYLISIKLLFPDYIEIIIPILMHLYYPGFGLPFTKLIFNEKMVHCLLLLVIFLLWRKQAHHHSLYDIFGLAFISYLAIFMLEGTTWFYHILPAIGMAILLCSILIFTHIKKLSGRSGILFFALSSILIYFTYYFTHLTYTNIRDTIEAARNGERSKIIAFLKQYPKQTTWSLISTKAVIFLVVDYANMASVSRFPNYWWLPGIIKLKNQPLSNTKSKILDQYLNYFTNLVVADIEKNKPRLILVDTAPYNTELKSKNIDYIDILSHNKNFNTVWRHYHYITTLDSFAIYEYDQK